MGWKLKTGAFLAFVMFMIGCAWLGFSVYARYQGNEYLIQVTAAFNAAALVNGEETYTDADRSVISTCEGQSYVILPDNYKAIVSLLRKDHVMSPFRRVRADAPLSIVICGDSRLRIEPDRDSTDGALICLTTDAGRSFTMHVRGGNIWGQILQYATIGYSNRLNLPISPEAD